MFVTNSIAFVHQFDHVAFIRRGIILESGTYESLMENPNAEIAKLVYVLLFGIQVLHLRVVIAKVMDMVQVLREPLGQQHLSVLKLPALPILSIRIQA